MRRMAAEEAAAAAGGGFKGAEERNGASWCVAGFWVYARAVVK